MANTPVKFVRDTAAEQAWLDDPAHKAEAAARNMTPEQYLESRGGVNAQGYWADSFVEGYTGQPASVQKKYILENNLIKKVQQDQYGTWLGATSAAGTIARVDATAAKQSIQADYPKDPIAINKRLNELTKKANSGAAANPNDPTTNREYVGALNLNEIEEWNYLNSINNDLIKSRQIYGITNPDGTISMTYDNPNPEEGKTPSVGSFVGNPYYAPNQNTKWLGAVPGQTSQGLDTSGLTPIKGIPAGWTVGQSYNQANAFDANGKPVATDANGNVIPSTNTNGLTNPYAPDTQQYADFNKRVSAYDTLYNEFNKYGLGSMVERVKGLITDANASPSQFSIALQNTPEYQQRFAANQERIKAGLQALTPAEYIGLEDQYQNIMRNYGLPASYYSKDTLGTQSGFSKLLSNDVSAAELEDRIATAQQRVQNSNPEVLQALRQFYPDISNADILSYALDPQNALTNIKRKVTAAEIGGAALAQGLQANGGTAESLAGLGITKAQAQQGYTDIAGILPRGSQLADIYGQTPYTQQTAEAEVFNTAGAADAAAKRKKLTSLEQAQFSGSSGVGALGRDKAIYGAMQGQAGLY